MVIKDSYTPITNASELRIGNWISVINMCPKQADAFHIKFISEGDDQYAPIPLTEEWLIKFGFEDRHGYWDDVYLEVARHKEGWYHSINCNEYIDGEPFQYVHELQNLYFALCRKELTIKDA